MKAWRARQSSGGSRPSGPAAVTVLAVHQRDLAPSNPGYLVHFSAAVTAAGTPGNWEDDDGDGFNSGVAAQLSSGDLLVDFGSAAVNVGDTWRVLVLPPGLTFSGGGTLSIPQSGLVIA